MNIFLTLDYELFFGNPTGSAEKCMLQPTEILRKLSLKYNAPMTYFVDVGYLIKLEEYKNENKELAITFNQIISQLKQLLREGNDVQLHIHPHWEDCTYENGAWNMVTHLHYKLSDFSEFDAEKIVIKYKTKLEQYIGTSVHSFRAGGWCIQPFNHVKDVFESQGLKYDSTVFEGGFFKSEHYYFDFRNVPKTGRYSFSTDITKEDKSGAFTEIPIMGMRYSPLFYWKLYGFGRLKPSRHKMIGDGNFIAQPGRKQKHLTKSTWNHVAMDGYFASKLKRATKIAEGQNRSDMVVIGHPKGMTHYAFEQVEKYLKNTTNKHLFKTFRNQ